VSVILGAPSGVRYADLPLTRLWGEALDTNPPLYYSLEKFWLSWLGHSETAVRSLSAVLGTASIPLVYALGRSLIGTGAGLFAALLLATSALHIEYSQEARAYILLAAGATLAIAGLVRILDMPVPSDDTSPYQPVSVGRISLASPFPAWGAYVIGSLIALYAHNTAALLFILANSVLCGWWGTQRDFAGCFVRNWLLANLLILVAWAWWLPVVIYQTGAELRNFWLESPSRGAALDTAANVYGQIYFWRAQPFVTWGFVGLGVLGTGALYIRKPWPAALLAMVFVLVPTLTYVVRLFTPIFMLRTIL
jgi:uncharacterized membrane protein